MLKLPEIYSLVVANAALDLLRRDERLCDWCSAPAYARSLAGDLACLDHACCLPEGVPVLFTADVPLTRLRG